MAEKGAGAVAAEVEKAATRMFAFEMQFGPFAVAQLRLIAEMQALVGSLIPPIPNLNITDTLADPCAAETQFSITVEPIAASRKEANRVKREQPIGRDATVAIGNPPYKEEAKWRGGWIEGRQDAEALRARRSGAASPAPMDLWMPPVGWGVGAHSHHLKNLYVYFWRWAALKVFGSGHREAVGRNKHGSGIICFITVSGFLNGPGFQKTASVTAAYVNGLIEQGRSTLRATLRVRAARAARMRSRTCGGLTSRCRKSSGARPSPYATRSPPCRRSAPPRTPGRV